MVLHGLLAYLPTYLAISRLAQRRHPSDMSENGLNDDSQQWMSITGQPLDLGLRGSGFQGTKP